MDEPILTIEERAAINSGRWFSSLSPSLRHDILRCAYVKRFQNGALICARGDPPEEWIACAKGAVRVSSTSISGKQITLTYVEPGIWFGDVSMFDGDRRTHDTHAHGATTIVQGIVTVTIEAGKVDRCRHPSPFTTAIVFQTPSSVARCAGISDFS